MYKDSDIQAIKKKVDILAFLEHRGVSFRQSGTSFVGLCPIHDESTPSFHVSPLNQSFHCFGCGRGGDIFSLVEELDGITFPAAVQELADYANIQLEDTEDSEEYKQLKRYYAIVKEASEYFRSCYMNLPASHPAKQNMSKRGLLAESIRDETIGWSEQGLLKALFERHYKLEDIITVGLAQKDEKTGKVRETFRNRLMWTISDISGKPIAFSGRKILETDIGPKYKNSPPTPLYDKSKALLGIERAKRTVMKEKVIYVVEGQTDVMAMRVAGYENTVATCGTAFTQQHALVLLRLVNMSKDEDKFKVVFCFDGDKAGDNAAFKIYEKITSLFTIAYVVSFNHEALVAENGMKDVVGSDPCDIRSELGNDFLYSFVQNHQQRITEFVLERERRNWDLGVPEEKSSFIDKALQIISNIENSIQRESYLREISLWTGVSYSQILQMHIPSQYQKRQQSTETTVQSSTKEPAYVKQFLGVTLQYPRQMLPLWEKYGIDETFFSTLNKISPELVPNIIHFLHTGEIDTNDKTVSLLLHTDFKVDDTRQDEALEWITKEFLRLEYLRSLEQIESSVSSEIDEIERLKLLLTRQQNMKAKYHQA